MFIAHKSTEIIKTKNIKIAALSPHQSASLKRWDKYLFDLGTIQMVNRWRLKKMDLKRIF